LPFTEWPYGGITEIVATRAASVDSPFMAAISETDVRHLLAGADTP
jgi:hypothetical protein